MVEHDDPEAYRKAVETANRKHFLKRLWGKSYPAVEPSQLVFSEHELRMLDMDKSWDGLNFTFRTLWPEALSFFEHTAETDETLKALKSGKPEFFNGRHNNNVTVFGCA